MANIVAVAQETGDPRIMAIMDAGIGQLADTPNALPTVLLQYNELLKEQEERERDDMPNQFLKMVGD